MNAFAESKLRWIVLGLCGLAGIRVFIFAAAFPFFDNVDEQAHVDLVIKYSHGKVPRGIELFAPESALYFAVYSSPEYFVKPEQYGGQFPPPNWLLPREQLQKVFESEIPFWESRVNHESGEPPVYYGLAGGWLDLGHVFGLRGLRLLYWVRFLNIGFGALLVWLGFAAAKSIFPDNSFLQISVPMLLAVWPQTALYSIQGDAFSPVCFGIAFLGVAKMLQQKTSGVVVAAWSGLAVAATCLVKTSNLPLPIIATAVIAWKIFAGTKPEDRRTALAALAVFVLSFAVPLGIWFASNRHYFGDITATKSKIELLGWTQKPFTEWWSHPIFTAFGLGTFWTDLAATFWRGEFIWHMKVMSSGSADLFYAISTATVVITAFVFLLRKPMRHARARFVLWFGLLSFLSIVAFLGALSISFDFGRCPYPSRDYPYLTSGRLLNATAVPFFLLLAYALDRFGSWTKRQWTRWALLAAIVLLATGWQIQANAPAFVSRYNFYHRPSSPQ